MKCTRRAFTTGAVGAALAVIAAPAQGVVTAYGIPRVSLPDFPGTGAGTRTGTAWALLLATSTLLTMGADGLIHGGLAISSALSRDRQQLDLQIRPDALFSDRTLVRPEDVVASILYARDAAGETPDAWRWEHLESVEVVDSGVVRLTLNQPDASIPALLSSHHVPIRPESWPANDAFPPASGCFRLDYQTEDRMRFTRNDGFFQVGRPRLAGVLCNAPTTTIPRTTELVAGGVDLLIDAPLLDVPMLKEDPSITLVGGPSNRLCMLTVNLQSATVADRRFRRLISSAIDRVQLVAAATADEAVPTATLIPAEHWSGLKFDVETADPDDVRAQLSALGKPPGIELRLVANDADASLVNACVLLQEQLAWAGIALSLDLLSDAEMEAGMDEGSWDLLMTHTDNWRDPHELVRPLITKDGSGNRGGYDNDRIDYLVDLASRARNQEYRGGLYRTIQQIIIGDAPVIPLFFPNYFDAMSTRIQNYPFFPPISATAMSQATIAKPDPGAHL